MRCIIATILLIGMAVSASAAEVDDPLSYRTLRYTGVIGQADWYTCGPAAVATLLIHYFGIETSEVEILELSEGFMRERRPEASGGISSPAAVLYVKLWGGG